MPRLQRHQIRSTENLSNIILQEDTFFKDLQDKVEAGAGIGDSLLSVPPDYATPARNSPAEPMLESTDSYMMQEKSSIHKNWFSL